MNRKKYIYGFLLGLTITSVTACSPKIDNTNKVKPEINQESVVDENQTSKTNILEDYNKLIADDKVSIKEVASFMKDNTKNATKEEVSTMIVGLEELQINNKASEDEKYLPEQIQTSFYTLATEKIDFNQTDTIKDETIKKLVTGSIENGYKIETAEGYYFPIINYSFYKQFSSYATPEMKDYIDIMTVESDNVFAKDAALVISWDEVVSRTLAMEKFLSNYPNASKGDYIKSFYDNYIFITMHGLDNTPLFDYESKQMDENAKSAFTNALALKSDSEYIKKLDEFMNIAMRSNYKLSDKVESYREENVHNSSDGSYENSEEANDIM